MRLLHSVRNDIFIFVTASKACENWTVPNFISQDGNSSRRKKHLSYEIASLRSQ